MGVASSFAADARQLFGSYSAGSWEAPGFGALPSDRVPKKMPRVTPRTAKKAATVLEKPANATGANAASNQGASFMLLLLKGFGRNETARRSQLLSGKSCKTIYYTHPATS